MEILSTLPWLITAVGAFFIIRLRAFFILHPIKTLRPILGGSGSDMRALALALAGTLGVGNILGVSVGIAIGGAGSVLWLLVSSVFSSAIKYCEVCLSVDEVKRGGDGIGSAIRKSAGRLGTPLSKLFTLLCLLLSLSMGAALQCSAIAESASASLGISPAALIFPTLAAVALATVKGGDGIEKLVSILIPLTTFVYIFLCLSAILPNLNRLPEVLRSVVSSAFNIKSCEGGILGFLISKPLSEGYARGILSNEAGAGTSSFAHIRSCERSPHAAGLFGILEVTFDTVILCSLTAFAILLGLGEEKIAEGGFLISEAIGSALGELGETALFATVISFALSTVVCWYYYGDLCFGGLVPRCTRFLYFPIFLAACGAGLIYSGEGLILISDILLFCLSLITLSTLVLNRRRIFDIYKESQTEGEK